MIEILTWFSFWYLRFSFLSRVCDKTLAKVFVRVQGLKVEPLLIVNLTRFRFWILKVWFLIQSFHNPKCSHYDHMLTLYWQNWLHSLVHICLCLVVLVAKDLQVHSLQDVEDAYLMMTRWWWWAWWKEGVVRVPMTLQFTLMVDIWPCYYMKIKNDEVLVGQSSLMIW